jgi:acetyltransferase
MTQSLDITLSEAGKTNIVTHDGVALTLRAVSEEDAGLLTRFYDSLSPEDMRFRFLSAQAHLSTAQLTAMVTVDHRHREHLLAFRPDNGELVASLLIAADEAFDVAEVAVSVASAYKGHGVGWSLLRHAVELARERGIRRLRCIESRANSDAIEVERALGFRSSDYEGDATVALLEIDLR